MMRKTIMLCTILALVHTSPNLLGHFTWISPISTSLKVGETVMVRVGNGHEFPQSETALPMDNLKVFAVSPGGAKTDLQPSVAGDALSAEYKVTQPGMHLFYLVQDRGVSKTSTGWKPGGRDQHPNAAQTMKLFRSAVAYGMTAGSKFQRLKPQGLPFEMLAEVEPGQISLLVLKDSRPCHNAQVVALSPQRDEQVLGKTDAQGRLVFRGAAGVKGPMLFSASYQETSPKGSNYDSLNHSAAIYLWLE
jgi:uncharacterized GH25 family protein